MKTPKNNLKLIIFFIIMAILFLFIIRDISNYINKILLLAILVASIYFGIIYERKGNEGKNYKKEETPKMQEPKEFRDEQERYQQLNTREEKMEEENKQEDESETAEEETKEETSEETESKEEKEDTEDTEEDKKEE